MADKESSFPWFRFYTEAAHDVKLKSIAKELEVDFLDVIGAWVMILCLASESPVRGSLYVTVSRRYSNGDVTDELHVTSVTADKLLKSFIDYDMLEIDENGAYRCKNWEKRQPKSDNSNERVHKFREKAKCNGNETLQKRYSNGLDKDKDIDTDKDIKYPLPEISFVTKFISTAGVQFNPLMASDQAKEIDALVVKYGEEKILEIADWCHSKKMHSMTQVLAAITSSAPNWNKGMKSKTAQIADKNKAVFKKVLEEEGIHVN